MDDRVIPRFGRYLRDHLGWPLTARPIPAADAYYLSGYFENGLLRPWRGPVAAYFTHREEQPPGNSKSTLFDRVAAQVDLRLVTAAIYGEQLAGYGFTAQMPPPVERERFTIPAGGKRRVITAGFSGYTYKNGRKGEALARKLVALHGRGIAWQASGRGWPVATRHYAWSQMPAFYQSLDIYVVTADVEGVPMPALEALACGVSLVAPRGVGLLDELPDVGGLESAGIHRYKRGDAGDLVRAFGKAVKMRPRVDRDALRAVTEPYTVAAWCEAHCWAFERLLGETGIMLNQRLTATDGEIMAEVQRAYPEVSAVLSWTRKNIPQIKRQIAPYQGAVLAYYAHQQDRPGARFLEIGTALGYSACLMATAAPRARIVTLNPKPGEFEKAAAALRIRSNVAVIQQTSEQYWKVGGSELYNLVFVDGDHSYRMVLHDSQFFNRLRPGGVILFHDYSPDGSDRPSAGSYQALNELQEKHRPFDVLVVGSGQVGMCGWIRREGETWN